MANVVIDNSNLTNIANAIRSKNGTETTYKPSEMATAIENINTETAWGEITGTLSNQEDLQGALDAKEVTSNKVTSLSSSSTDTQYASAKATYDADQVLNTRIDNLSLIGRYLALWNCATGLPTTNPGTLPYTYKSGDYYRVSAVASSESTNYCPTGTAYDSTASTTAETESVAVGDVYFYDGTNWTLQINHFDTGVEQTINKVTSLSASSTDIQYPSAKATYDYVNTNGGKIDHIQVNGTEQTITDKTVNILVPVIPTQTNNSGKFLTTDGSSMSWGQVAKYAKTDIEGEGGGTCLMPSSAAWSKIIYANEKYVAISLTGQAAYSSDGLTWTATSLPAIDTSQLYWAGLAYGANKFVAVTGTYEHEETATSMPMSAYSTDGITWTLGHSLPSYLAYSGLAYGNDKFITIGRHNLSAYSRVATSSDGISWAEYNPPSNCDKITDIAFGNGNFIAVESKDSSNYGSIYYSTNGTSWSYATLSSYNNWASVSYCGDGKFVAVPSGVRTRAAYSSDNGVTWSTTTLPYDAAWCNVAYGEGKFVTLCGNKSKAAYSTDNCSTWTTIDLSSSVTVASSLCYGADKFVAVGTYSSTATYSTNGTLWNGKEILRSYYDLKDKDNNEIPTVYKAIYNESSYADVLAAYNNGHICVVDYTESSTVYRYVLTRKNSSGKLYFTAFYDEVYSGEVSVELEDGETVWEMESSQLENTANKVTSISSSSTDTQYPSAKCVYDSINTVVPTQTDNSGRFLTTDGTNMTWGDAVKYSKAPTDWNSTQISTYANWYSICYGNGKFVAIATSSTRAAVYSIDGITWTYTTLPSGNNWTSVCYGNGKFVAVARGTGQSNVTAYSSDGITWTASTLPTSSYWNSVCYGNDKFIAVANGTASAAYSSDGITWTAFSLPKSTSWETVCYGDNKFVAVSGTSGIAAYSTDGLTWTATTMPSEVGWNSVCYGNGKFVAVALNSSAAAYSTDGINWTASTLPSSQYWRSVCYGNNYFVTISSTYNWAAYSSDGITWTAISLSTSGQWVSICYGTDRFVAVANGLTFIYCIPRYSLLDRDNNAIPVFPSLGTISLTSTWTGTYYATGTTTVTSGSVTIDVATFVQAYSTVGSHVFTYDGTDWTDSSSTTVTLSDIGITLTGTPAADNTITVVLSQAYPYYQTVTVSGATITANSKIDIQPNATVITQLIDDGCNALYIANDNGTLTCYAVREHPTVALSSIQVCVTEVTS